MRNMTIIVGLAILIPQTASASWQWVPLEKALVDADLVVVGKITDVKTDDKQMLDIGTITIEKVLKGAANLKSAKLAWSPHPKPSQMSYKKGQNGIWLLIKERKYDWHWGGHPVNFQPLSQLEAIKNKLAEIRVWEWGKPVNGLSVHLSVLPDEDEKKYGNPFLIYVKNCSKKTLLTPRRYLGKPLIAERIGPGGKPVPVDLFKGGNPGHVKPITKHDFWSVSPGEVKVIIGPARLPKKLEAGEYQITATLSIKDYRKKFDLENAWEGQAVSNKVSFRISK